MTDTHTIAKIVKRFREFRYQLVLGGICVGVASGLVVIAFRLALEHIEALRSLAVDYIGAHPWAIPIWFGVLVLGAVVTTLLLKWEPMIAGSGIPQVDGEIQGFFHQNWWRILLAKFVGGVITIGCGLSLGREGPSIQLGAMAGKGFARVTKRMRTEQNMLMTCGASAGLAAAFNAPLAGVLFALEEVHKNFSTEVLLSSMASSVISDFLSRHVFGLRPVFDFSTATAIPLSHSWVVILVGIFIGLLGVLYNRCIDRAQNFYDRISNRFIRTLIPFLMAGVLALVLPVVLGGGSEFIMQVAKGIPLPLLLLLFVVKFGFSIFSFSAGVPGGIFLPLLVLGAMSGGVFHGIAAACGLELNLSALVILGMASSFAAIVRAPVTGILLITEMTGNFSHLLFLSMAALTAYTVADLMRAKPIYEQLLRRMLLKVGLLHVEESHGEKLLLEIPIHPGAPICGKCVAEVNLPDRCLIISVQRGGHEIVPRGDTMLQSGDVLVSLCDEYDFAAMHYALDKQCRTAEHVPAR